MNDLASVKETRFPFTPHDIFSYIVPGALSLILIYQFELWCRRTCENFSDLSIHTPFLTAVQEGLLQSVDGAETWAVVPLYVVAVLIFTYVAGHLIASVSVLILDRILISKGYGYPYQTLLDVAPHEGLKKDVSAPFYRGIFFWTNVYLATRFMTIFHEVGTLAMFVRALGWLIVISILLRWLSAIPYRHFPKQTGWFWTAYCWPYQVVSDTITRVTRTKFSFPPSFTDTYREGIKHFFGVTANRAGTGNYWMTSLFVRDESPALYQTIEKWHRMYSFTRNLAAAFYLTFAYCYASVWLQRDIFTKIDSYSEAVVEALPLIFLACSAVLTLRFYYLYVSKHSRLLYRTFVYLYRRRKHI